MNEHKRERERASSCCTNAKPEPAQSQGDLVWVVSVLCVALLRRNASALSAGCNPCHERVCREAGWFGHDRARFNVAWNRDAVCIAHAAIAPSTPRIPDANL